MGPHGHRLIIVGKLERNGAGARLGHVPLQVPGEAVLLDNAGPELREAMGQAARDGLRPVELGVRPDKQVVIVLDLLTSQSSRNGPHRSAY